MKICEKDIATLWQTGQCKFLSGIGCDRVKIIYPGRRNSQSGGDFRDAVIEIDGIRYYGNVEIHVSSDLWYRHGHHLDRAYNDVIMQVVLWDTGRLPALRQDGIKIPTLVIDPDNRISDTLITGNAGLRPPLCRYAAPLIKTGRLLELLTVEGMVRLVGKSDEYYYSLYFSRPEKIIYKGICRALGYMSNTVPFEQLAEHLPVEFLEGSWVGSPISLQAVVTGMAGLLPSQNPDQSMVFEDDMITAMEGIWANRSADQQEMERTQWNFAWVRPANNPVRRVVSLCTLINRYRNGGLLKHFDTLIQSESICNIWKIMEDGIIVGEEPYWRDHYDFGLKMATSASLLGRGRAREIVVNCILPFFLAFYRMIRLNSVAARVIEMYSCCPSLPENTISRYMKDKLFNGYKIRLNGCQLQGLLGIYYNYCKIKDCRRCPIHLS